MNDAPSTAQDQMDLDTPNSSRARILRAAITEFASRGFDGARMDSIARLAQLNKTLVYRHFKNKEGLFDKALKYKFGGRYRTADAVPASLKQALEYWFRHSTDDPEFMTLLHQEAIKSDEIVHQQLREQYYKERLSDLVERQKKKQIDEAFDPRMMLLALSALVMFPALFPQITKLISGKNPNDEEFKINWTQFLYALALRLEPN